MPVNLSTEVYLGCFQISDKSRQQPKRHAVAEFRAHTPTNCTNHPGSIPSLPGLSPHRGTTQQRTHPRPRADARQRLGVSIPYHVAAPPSSHAFLPPPFVSFYLLTSFSPPPGERPKRAPCTPSIAMARPAQHRAEAATPITLTITPPRSLIADNREP